MPASPFPGMDPYLERHWRDVHASLIFLAKSALQSQLGEGLIRTTYLACAYRAWVPDQTGAEGQFELYGLPLRQRLPGIRIPLRPTDADAALDLQSLVDGAGGYARTIDYAQPCEPPLIGPDANWADELLRHAGKR